jgi:hypothetical protein
MARVKPYLMRDDITEEMWEVRNGSKSKQTIFGVEFGSLMLVIG